MLRQLGPSVKGSESGLDIIGMRPRRACLDGEGWGSVSTQLVPPSAEVH